MRGHLTVRAFLLVAAVLASSGANAVGWQIPPNKAYIDVCRKAVLAGYPGTVTRVDVRSDATTTHVRFYVQQKDGAEWFVSCDGHTGLLTKMLRLDDN